MQQTKTMQNWTSRGKKTGQLPNWGRTTFYAMSGNHIKETPNAAFNKSKRMGRAQTQRHKLRFLGITQEQADLSKEYTYQANLALTASTWDAQHLDKFLEKSQWGEPNKRNVPESFPSVQLDSYDLAEAQESIKHSQKLPIETFTEYGLDAGQIQENVNMASPSQLLKESPMYRNQARWDSKAGNNSVYPDQMSKYNHLVVYKKNSAKIKRGYFDKNLALEAPNFDASKISIVGQPIRLQHPTARLAELNSVKKNNKRYRGWKNNFLKTKKRFKNHKQRMRSGIMNVDNPCEADTLIYKEEQARLNARETKKEKIRARFRRDVDVRRRTHSNMVFLNRKPKRFSVRQNGRLLTDKKTHHYRVKQLEPGWKSKARTPAMNVRDGLSKTHSNLFKPAQESTFRYSRAKYLFDRQRKG